MPELVVTEDQRRRLEAVCDDLEDAYVGPYGSVTPADAVEYLLDTYTPPGEASASGTTGVARLAGSGETSSQPVAVGTTDGTGRNRTAPEDGGTADDAADTTADDAADTTADDADLTAISGVGEVTAAALRDAGFDSIGAIRAADPAALTAADGVGEKQAIDISAAVEEQAAAGPDEDAATGSVSAEQALQQARSLLDAHDDRWREGSGDEPYEVDLPDGSTTGARTRDDVKRLLFKHWR